MKLDPRVVAIAKQFEPGLPLANWTDDNRRAWVMQVIEQVVFRFPDGGWGAKRSGPRRPVSRDAIALKRDGHVWAFDLVSASTKRVSSTLSASNARPDRRSGVRPGRREGPPRDDHTRCRC